VTDKTVTKTQKISFEFIIFLINISVSNLNKRTEGKSGSNHEELTHHQEERARKSELFGSGTPSEDQKERYADDDYDFYGGRGRGQKSVANSLNMETRILDPLTEVVHKE
jgi:hypothetical protein